MEVLADGGEEELLRQQAEWEKRGASIDQRRIEVLGEQWKLVRDCMKENSLVVSQLQQALHELQASSAVALERVKQLEGRLQEEVTQERTEREAEVRELKRLLNGLDAGAQGALERNHSAMQEHHASIQEQVSYLEKLLNESVDRHTSIHTAVKDVSDVGARNEQHLSTLQERCGQLEEQLELLRGQQQGHVDSMDEFLEKEASAREAHFTSIQELFATEMEAHRDHIKDHVEDVLGVERAVREKTQGALQEHHTSIQERIDFLETMLNNCAEQHASTAAAVQELPATTIQECFTKVEKQLEQLEREQEAREADIFEMRQLVGGEKLAREDHHSSVTELLALEAKERHALAGELQGQLADERAARERLHGQLRAAMDERLQEHRAALHERTDHFDRLLSEAADRHAALHAATKDLAAERGSQAAALQERVASLEHRLEQELQAATLSEQEVRERHHTWVQERVAHLEKLLSESADEHAATRAVIEECLGRWRDGTQEGRGSGSLQERLSNLEKKIEQDVKSEQKTKEADIFELRDIIGGDMWSREGHLSSVKEYVEKEKQAREVHLSTVQDLLAQERNNRSLQVDAVKEHLASEKVIRENHQETVEKQLALQHASLDDRISHLEAILRDCMDRHTDGLAKQRQTHEAQVEDVQAQVMRHQEKIMRHLSEHKEELHAHRRELDEDFRRHQEQVLAQLDLHREEVVARDGSDKLRAQHEQHRQAVADHLAQERNAREAHARELRDALEGHRSAVEAQHSSLHMRLNREQSSRELHESRIGEQLRAERQARERHADSVTALVEQDRQNREKHIATIHEAIRQERQQREAHHSGHQEALARERASREQAHRQLQDALASDRTELLERHENYRELITNEQEACSGKIDRLLAEEESRREKHQAWLKSEENSITQRLASLERTVGMFGNVVRAEQMERAKDIRSLWEALDGHAHDVGPEGASPIAWSAVARAGSPLSSLRSGAGDRAASPVGLRSVAGDRAASPVERHACISLEPPADHHRAGAALAERSSAAFAETTARVLGCTPLALPSSPANASLLPSTAAALSPGRLTSTNSGGVVKACLAVPAAFGTAAVSKPVPAPLTQGPGLLVPGSPLPPSTATARGTMLAASAPWAASAVCHGGLISPPQSFKPVAALLDPEEVSL